MTEKLRELADVMERRNVDIMCLQETKWKKSKARNVGDGCKLFTTELMEEEMGQGEVREKQVESVLGVKRVSDRLLAIKL